MGAGAVEKKQYGNMVEWVGKGVWEIVSVVCLSPCLSVQNEKKRQHKVRHGKI